MTLLFIDGEPMDTTSFLSTDGLDKDAYTATLESALRPHINHVLASSHPGQRTHYNVITCLGLGEAGVYSLSERRPPASHVELVSFGSYDGIFLPARSVFRFFGGDRTIICLTCKNCTLQQATASTPFSSSWYPDER